MGDAYFFKDWRMKIGLTQDEVGKRVGCSGATVSRIEKGERDFTGKYLVKFSRICGCTFIGDPISRPPGFISVDELFPGDAPHERQLRATAREIAETLRKRHGLTDG